MHAGYRSILRALAFACTPLLAVSSCGAPPSLKGQASNAAEPAGRLPQAPTATWTRGTELRDTARSRGAYFVPAGLPPGSSLVSALPDGTRLLTVDGLRVAEGAHGTLRAAPTRFTATPKVLRLGAHLGGGYLFVVGGTVWKAAGWLDEAKPLWVSALDVATLYEGLDRIYARSANGTLTAFDVQSGATLDLGGWPRTPTVTTLLALDRFRAVALSDLRGVLFTEDAGKTWTAQAPSFDPQSLARAADGVVIAGTEGTPPRPVRYLVGAQGFLSPLPADAQSVASATPAAPSPSASAVPKGTTAQSSRTANLVVEGWPLGDGTFLHAFEGDLVRYDGATFREVGRAVGAFEDRRATCHGIALPKKSDKAAFGFVCGEPEGATTVYAYVAGALERRIRFAAPREIHAAGTGSLAVRGNCDDARFRQSKGQSPTYCIVNESGSTREVDLRGSVDQARLVALADGRIVVLSPPHGVLGHARISLLENGSAKTIPLQFAPNLLNKVASVLEHGLWLDNWEEREPGTIGGWVEAGGALVGVEVQTSTGRTVTGTLLTDPVAYSTSGRFGFGWTNGRRGFETVDGGMHWDQVSVPDRDSGSVSALRGCSPVGCVGRGWIRIGWGDAKDPDMPTMQSVKSKSSRSPGLSLSCEVEKRVAAVTKDDSSEETSHRVAAMPSRFRGLASRAPAVPATWSSAEPFWNTPGPATPRDAIVVHGDSFDIFGGSRNLGLVGRAYAWGPKGIDWDRGVSWNVYWLSPFDASNRTMHAKATTIPAPVLDWLKPLSVRGGPSANWQIAVDDSEHALFGMRAYTNGSFTTTLFALDASRTAAQISRNDGETFGQVGAAVRVGSRWVVMQTQPSSPERPAIALFVIEGTSARLVAKLPRILAGAQSVTLRLAAGPTDHTVGIVVDPNGSGAERWIIPVKLDSGEVLDPEPVGLVDFTDKSLRGCDRAGGYRFDTPVQGTVTMGAPGNLFNVVARVRVAQNFACIEAMTGNYNQALSDLMQVRPRATAKPGTASTTEAKNDAFFASAAVAGTRQLLRCKATQ